MTLFFYGVVGVSNGDRNGIIENCSCFLKTDLVLFEVGIRFFFIPLKGEGHSG
jgi:hypothetical protein